MCRDLLQGAGSYSLEGWQVQVFMGSAGSLEDRDKRMSRSIRSILKPSHILRLPHRLHEEGQVLFYPSLPLIR